MIFTLAGFSLRAIPPKLLHIDNRKFVSTIICTFMDYECQEILYVNCESHPVTIDWIRSWAKDDLPFYSLHDDFTCIFDGKIISLDLTTKDLGFMAGGTYYFQFINLEKW